MGLRTIVHSLYGDLFSGTVIFKLYDLIKPRSVNWRRVTRQFATAHAKANFQQLENCNYMVELGHRTGFSLVGVAGSDLKDRTITPILSLLWQLMRSYTLAILARLAAGTKEPRGVSQRARSPVSNEQIISEQEIIDWTNGRLAHAGKSRRITTREGFADINLRTGLLVIDLLDAIRPGCVDYSLVNSGETAEARLSNAQYAITVARRVGAKIFAVAEDITEVKSRMLMTVFACLMATDIEKNGKQQPGPPSCRTNSPSPLPMSPGALRSKSPSPARDSVGETLPTHSSPTCEPQTAIQLPVDIKTLVESRENLSKLGPPVPRPTANFAMEKSVPLTKKLQLVGKGTNYDPPLRRFFASPPPTRSRHAELFSSPRLYRSDLTRSATALDQIGRDELKPLRCKQTADNHTPTNPLEKAVQCEFTFPRSGHTVDSWNRPSRKSDIFAASVRGGDVDGVPDGVPWQRSYRLDGITSPRCGFAAAYEEYANKTVQANRKAVRRGGGRVFMAADMVNNLR